MKHPKLGHQARKRFGQNFLEDQSVIDQIVRSIHPIEGDNLVEIGPGLGALTEQLLEAGDGHLQVVELDRDLIPILRTKFFNYPNFQIHEADALKFDFATLRTSNKGLRIIGNLPYNISTPLIFHLLALGPAVIDMHFMLQKEVVQRLAADPGSKHYGRLGIMAQYLCEIEHLFNVSPEAFNPAPKVDSAIVRLVPRAAPLHPVNNTEHLELIVKSAFSQRRKTLRNTLKNHLSTDDIEAIGVDPSARPETLSIKTFAELANQYTATREIGHGA
jgi:16S rRNA (adenine1518-N6/adenine1519-N6)-dimethyltransferase